jgi:hypothetical protein
MSIPAEHPPETLGQLRLAALMGYPHLACVRRVCPTVDVWGGNWRSALELDPPHLAVVESSGLRKRGADARENDAERIERAEELLAWCQGREIPVALWETSPLSAFTTPASLMEKFGHVFVADPEAVAALAEQLGGRRPMQLPLAAQVVPERPAGFSDRTSQVAFFARRPHRLRGGREKELEMVLDAAIGHDLVILRRKTDRETELPDRFTPLLTPVATNRDAIESLQGSRIAVGVDPRNDAALMVPQLVFDALAAGTVVIVPNHQRGVITLFRYTAVSFKTRKQAEAELDRLLNDEEEWKEASGVSRRTILNAHTYPHRIATIASAAGLRLIPEPERAYAFITG